MRAGAVPDRFLVGLAVLSLLSEAADERPLLCVIDDAQWLDRASALTLAFVARRVPAERVGLVFAAREIGVALTGVPETCTWPGSARNRREQCSSSTMQFPLDESVRDRIIAETRGNPLALLELPRPLTANQLAGGFGLVHGDALSGEIEKSLVRRLGDSERPPSASCCSPPPSRSAIRCSCGGPPRGWQSRRRRRSRWIPTSGSASTSTCGSGIRSCARPSTAWAPPEDRRVTHLALADVIDGDADADRRAWHLAMAAHGPDEAVALELEHSADRAQARGGLAAAAAFLERALALTADPARLAARAILAAQASLHAGAFEAAGRLLGTAEAGRSTSSNERGRAAAGSDRVCGEHGCRRAAVASGRCAAPRADRPRAGPGDLPRRLGARAVRRSGSPSAPICSRSRAPPGRCRRPSESADPSAQLLDALSTLVIDGPAQTALRLLCGHPRLRRPRTSGTGELPLGLDDDDPWRTCCGTRRTGTRRYAPGPQRPRCGAPAGCRSTWPHGRPSSPGEASSPLRRARSPGRAATEATGPALCALQRHPARRVTRARARRLGRHRVNRARCRGGGQGIGVQWAEWAHAILLTRSASTTARSPSRDRPVTTHRTCSSPPGRSPS